MAVLSNLRERLEDQRKPNDVMLAESHSKSSKRERKAKKSPLPNGNMPTMTEMYRKADETIDAVYCDIANGMSRSDCLKKIQLGAYGNKPVKERQSAYIYNAALDRFAVDCDVEAERLRNVFYGRYEALLEECVRKGDMYNARGILDSMSRIFGIEKKTPSTAIQINSDKENGITVNFGFGEKEETNED